MSRTIMGAVVSLDGFIADDDDGIGPLFDFLGNGDVTWTFPGGDDVFRSTRPTADFMRRPRRVRLGASVLRHGCAGRAPAVRQPVAVVAGNRVTHLVYDVTST